MLWRGEAQRLGDVVTPEEELKDSFILEFLGLKDERTSTPRPTSKQH